MSLSRISRAPFAPSDSYLEPRFSRRRFPFHNNMNSSGFIIGADDIGPRYLQNLSKVIEMKQKQADLLRLEKDLLRNQLRKHAGRGGKTGEEYGQMVGNRSMEMPSAGIRNSESESPERKKTMTRRELQGREEYLPAITPPIQSSSKLFASQRFRGRPRLLRNPITGAESSRWYE